MKFLHVLLTIGSVAALAAEPVTAAAVDFERDIRPILNNQCAGCHGGVKKNSGLSVLARDFLTREADSGEVPVRPGDANGSELITRVASADPSLRMPPEGHDPVSDRNVKLLREWIDAGAHWPAHWAYAPVPALPDVTTFDGRHPVDWYVGKRLATEGIKPSQPAEPDVLTRRLSLDLTGLLPAPAAASAPTAGASGSTRVGEYQETVARLLASPHFGERWGRHWLDEARYADSEGYEKDSVKADAYRYRDWVIDAINDDMAFDEFTRRQIAGDLLPDATDADRVATKFHLQTQFNLEGGVDSEEDRTKRVVDRVSTVSSVWMGSSLGCTQCHDHPYDSFQHEDFYRLYAFFNNMDFTADYVGNEPTDADKARNARRTKWNTLADLLKKQVSDKNYSDDCQRELTQLRKFDNENDFTRVMTERSVDRRLTYVFTRGDFRRPMTEQGPVSANVPGIFDGFVPRGDTADRLDLANWLVSGENPLTARVTVNKVWLHLFGQPLADQPQEFGSRGSAPSHPELLDYLARWFVEEARWSRKELVRFIVASQTYRQSSVVRPELIGVDPDNRLLARQNRFRMEAEIVRDISLQAAGLISSRVGGPSVFPPLPEIIAQQTYAGGFKFKVSEGADRYRRGMYTFFRRTAIDPNLSTFDCPDSSLTVAQRDRSNNPLQALATLHNEVYHEAAQAFAKRLLTTAKAGASDTDRLASAFRITLNRTPATGEPEPLLALLNSARGHFSDQPDHAKSLLGNHATGDVPPDENAAWVVVARVILNLDEFLTRS